MEQIGEKPTYQSCRYRSTIDPSCGSRTWLSNSTLVCYIHFNSSLGMSWFLTLFTEAQKCFYLSEDFETHMRWRVQAIQPKFIRKRMAGTRHAVRFIPSASLLLGRDIFSRSPLQKPYYALDDQDTSIACNGSWS